MYVTALTDSKHLKNKNEPKIYKVEHLIIKIPYSNLKKILLRLVYFVITLGSRVWVSNKYIYRKNVEWKDNFLNIFHLGGFSEIGREVPSWSCLAGRKFVGRSIFPGAS